MSFTVSWDPPYINGHRLEWYELCVGGDPLTTRTQACESPLDCFYVEGPESSSAPNTAGCSQLKLASPDMLVGDVNYHFRRGTEQLYIQVCMYIGAKLCKHHTKSHCAIHLLIHVCQKN